MKPVWYILIGSSLIAIGEALAIYCEVTSVKYMDSTRKVLEMFWWITVAGVPLILGYILAYKGFKNIWPVSVVSVVSILIAEPVLNWFILKEGITLGPILGFVFGIIGFICVLFIK